MAGFKKINGQLVRTTTEGHPEYFFDTQAQAEAALSQLEEGAIVNVLEGGNSDLNARMTAVESGLANIGLSLVTDLFSNTALIQSSQAYRLGNLFIINANCGSSSTSGWVDVATIDTSKYVVDLVVQACGLNGDKTFHVQLDSSSGKIRRYTTSNVGYSFGFTMVAIIHDKT